MINGNLILGIVQVVLSAVIGGYAFLLRRVLHDHDERHRQIDGQQIEQNERLKQLERDTVSKEDWLRESSITRKKLEQIDNKIERLAGQNQAAVEIGAAIAAAMNRSRGGAGD